MSFRWHHTKNRNRSNSVAVFCFTYLRIPPYIPLWIPPCPSRPYSGVST